MKRSRDLWHELCDRYSTPDGLPTWKEAGIWTRDKLFFWKRYIDITTAAMAGNRAFPDGLIYVDLFGGAGICSLKGSNKRFPGSVLIAAHAKKPFRRIIVCKTDPSLAEACRTRLNRCGTDSETHVLSGDCNDLIGEVVRLIPPNTLTLAFVDPKGLDAQFTTIETLANCRRADFVILFADAYDINRNMETVYRSDPGSKLDRVLGPNSNWRGRLEALANADHVSKRQLFVEIYESQLRRMLGYRHFDEKVMMCKKLPLYRLVYASKNPLGLKFWREAIKEDSRGQRNLFD